MFQGNLNVRQPCNQNMEHMNYNIPFLYGMPEIMQPSFLSSHYSIKSYNQIDPFTQDYRYDNNLDSEVCDEKRV